MGFSNTAQLVVHAYGGENDPGHNPEPRRVPQLGLVHDRERGAIGELLDLNRTEDRQQTGNGQSSPGECRVDNNDVDRQVQQQGADGENDGADQGHDKEHQAPRIREEGVQDAGEETGANGAGHDDRPRVPDEVRQERQDDGHDNADDP